MEVNTFCDALRGFLEHSGVSQNSLAKQSGVSQSQISDWSKGKLTRFGKNPKKVMDIIDSYQKSHVKNVSKKVIDAVADYCGGSSEKELKLIKLLELIK